jgi:hypothetical protein
VRRLILIPLLLALICSLAMAQRGFSGAHVGAHFSGRFSSQRGGRYWPGYATSSLFWDSLYPNSFFDSGYPVAAAPPFIVIQQPPASSAAQVLSPQPAPPLLIEWRGGRYVQISGEQTSDFDADNVAQHPAAQPPRSYAVQATRPIPPPSAILVFRDGSREQISGYTIADGVLYAQQNFYTDGSWNKKVLLTSLDLPSTVKENQARGISFQLPAAPNQVIVGP